MQESESKANKIENKKERTQNKYVELVKLRTKENKRTQNTNSASFQLALDI